MKLALLSCLLLTGCAAHKPTRQVIPANCITKVEWNHANCAVWTDGKIHCTGMVIHSDCTKVQK